jgi:hypothetical protein
MTRPPRNPSSFIADAVDEARRRLDEQLAEASAWLEWVARGAPAAKGCVVCDIPVKTEGNHVAGWRHGDLVVPMCVNCHRRFSRAQYTWDPAWQSEACSAALDETLLILGLAQLCEQRADHRGPTHLELADRLRAMYFVRAREMIA